MMQNSLIVFSSLILIGSANLISFYSCDFELNEDKQSYCTINEINLYPCPILDGSDICVVRKDRNLTVTVGYTPRFTCKTMKISQSRSLNNRITPIVPVMDGDIDNPCQPGTMMSFSYLIPAFNVYETGIYQYQVKMWNEPYEKCCATYPVHHV